MINEDNDICSIENYCALPVSSLLIWGQTIPYPLYIRLGVTKLIKVVNADDDYFEPLQRLSDKGVRSIWLERDAFDGVTKCIQSCVASLMESQDEERYDLIFGELGACFNVLKGIVASTGLQEEHLLMAQDIAVSCLEIIRKHRNYLSLFARLAEVCNKSFLRSIFTGYISTGMMGSFEWSTKQLKEQVMTASLLSDVLLDGDELRAHSRWEDGKVEYKELPLEVKIHAEHLAMKLESDCSGFFTDDVVTIIRYHHCDNSIHADVNDLMMSKLPILPAIYIVARRAVLAVEKGGEIFDSPSFVSELQKQFDRGHFRSVVRSLERFWRYG